MNLSVHQAIHFSQFRLRAPGTLSVRFQLFRDDFSSVLKRKKQGGSHFRATDVSGLRFALALASGHARDTESIECNSRLVDQCQPAFTRGSQRMAVFESRLFRFMQAGAVRLPIHARARQSASPLTSHPHRSHGRVYLDVVAELGQKTDSRN